MRKEYQKPFVIIALNAGNFRFEMDILEAANVRDEQIKPLLGVYTSEDGKHVSEHSYLIVYDDSAQLQSIKELARRLKQESVLVVDSERMGELHYLETDGGQVITGPAIKRLGQWSEVSGHTAKQEKAYTFAPVTGKYYVC